MKKIESIKLLKSILNSNEKKRFNSENNYYKRNNFNTNKCQEHNDFYNKVCLKCNIDICPKCAKNFHRNHQMIGYEEIFPDIFEIQNLQRNIKIYLDNFELLRNEINSWFDELKEKMECFELLYKKNEIINSYDFIMNFSYKNIICFENIYKFRKLYYNIINDENNVNNKNKDIFMKINNNYANEVLPNYLNPIGIKNLLKNLSTKKKNELIIKYLLSLPSDIINNNSEKYNSINNNKKTVSSISPIEKINSNSICDKSTGYDNYKTISDIKTNEFKKIINKTIITDFNIENSYENNSKKTDINDLNNTFTVGKKNYNISTFNKYLDKMGIINTHSDLHKVNSYQNLLNKSSISIKSIKITNLKNSNSNTNFVYKKQNNILKGTKSAMNSPRADNIYKNNLVNNKKWYNNPLLTNKKTQMKTYVHKKFKNIVNNNQLNFTEIKNDNNIMKSNLAIQNNQNLFKNKEKLMKQELFKNDNINAISNNKNELEVNKEQNSMKTINKTHLLNLIYSPSSNRNNINVNKLSKINKLNLNPNNNSNQRIIPNPPRIIKTLKNIPIIINPQKELFLGLELSDSNCKFSLINQNPNEIQLINFSEDNNYSIPLTVSFSENKKEIKIGQEAQNDLMKNPSQTIFNIIKLLTKKSEDIPKEILPFKIYFTKDEENKAYIKINFGPQKDKIFYIENILSIYFQKLFEKFVHRIKFENEINKANIKIILVIAIPDYFTYYHRKLIEEMFKQEVIPKLNNYNKIINFNLEKIVIKNSSNISSLLYIMNNPDKIKNNINNNNILVINIDKGSSNISIVTSNKENNKEKINFKIKACTSFTKGANDILEDFIFYILNNRLDIEIKNEILKSPLALVKMRNLCEKIKHELLRNNKAEFNLKQIFNEFVKDNNKVIEININEYENCFYNYVYDFKQVMNKMIEYNNFNKSNCIINEIIYIGDIFKEENIMINIEELFKQKNLLSDDALINNTDYSDNAFYAVGGACFYGINLKNNIFSFKDISHFNLGIKTYNDTLYYLTKKGDIIPIRNKETIKIGKSGELELYEEDNKTKEKKLIGKFDIDNNINYNENKLNYNEITIEYELNEDLNLTIKIFTGENFSKEINCKLFLYKT